MHGGYAVQNTPNPTTTSSTGSTTASGTTTSSSATKPSTSSSLIDSHKVEGTDVLDPNGKHIGSIKRLVIDKVSGRVVYTVASFGGFLGMGGNEYTIPWNKLNYDPNQGGFVTDITEEQLRGSPDYGVNSGDDWYNRDYERGLHDYYGSAYYW
jgi:sporulation protein YlmC with PRC-barrel domain